MEAEIIGKTKITRSFQISLPAEIRAETGIKIGDEVIWVREKGEYKVQFIKRPKVSELTGLISAPYDSVTIKKMLQHGEL